MSKIKVVFFLTITAVLALLSGPLASLPVFSPISEIIAKVAHALFILSCSWLAFSAQNLLFKWLNKKVKATESSFDDVVVPIAKTVGVALIAIITLVHLGRPFGVDFTGLLAGLGLGGMALAFASKDTLSNFFGAICLICDAPFEIGDWIKTSSGVCGYVRKIGLRSTNIDTDDGSLVSIPNGTLAGLTIENFKHERPTP